MAVMYICYKKYRHCISNCYLKWNLNIVQSCNLWAKNILYTLLILFLLLINNSENVKVFFIVIVILISSEFGFHHKSYLSEWKKQVNGRWDRKMSLRIVSVQPTKGSGGRPKRSSGTNTPDQEVDKKGGASSTGSNSPGERAKKRVQASMGSSMACTSLPSHKPLPCLLSSFYNIQCCISFSLFLIVYRISFVIFSLWSSL